MSNHIVHYFRTDRISRYPRFSALLALRTVRRVLKHVGHGGVNLLSLGQLLSPKMHFCKLLLGGRGVLGRFLEVLLTELVSNGRKAAVVRPHLSFAGGAFGFLHFCFLTLYLTFNKAGPVLTDDVLFLTPGEREPVSHILVVGHGHSDVTIQPRSNELRRCRLTGNGLVGGSPLGDVKTAIALKAGQENDAIVTGLGEKAL